MASRYLQCEIIIYAKESVRCYCGLLQCRYVVRIWRDSKDRLFITGNMNAWSPLKEQDFGITSLLPSTIRENRCLNTCYSQHVIDG